MVQDCPVQGHTLAELPVLCCLQGGLFQNRLAGGIVGNGNADIGIRNTGDLQIAGPVFEQRAVHRGIQQHSGAQRIHFEGITQGDSITILVLALESKHVLAFVQTGDRQVHRVHRLGYLASVLFPEAAVHTPCAGKGFGCRRQLEQYIRAGKGCQLVTAGSTCRHCLRGAEAAVRRRSTHGDLGFYRLPDHNCRTGRLGKQNCAVCRLLPGPYFDGMLVGSQTGGNRRIIAVLIHNGLCKLSADHIAACSRGGFGIQDLSVVIIGNEGAILVHQNAGHSANGLAFGIVGSKLIAVIVTGSGNTDCHLVIACICRRNCSRCIGLQGIGVGNFYTFFVIVLFSLILADKLNGVGIADSLIGHGQCQGGCAIGEGILCTAQQVDLAAFLAFGNDSQIGEGFLLMAAQFQSNDIALEFCVLNGDFGQGKHVIDHQLGTTLGGDIPGSTIDNCIVRCEDYTQVGSIGFGIIAEVCVCAFGILFLPDLDGDLIFGVIVGNDGNRRSCRSCRGLVIAGPLDRQDLTGTVLLQLHGMVAAVGDIAMQQIVDPRCHIAGTEARRCCGHPHIGAKGHKQRLVCLLVVVHRQDHCCRACVVAQQLGVGRRCAGAAPVNVAAPIVGQTDGYGTQVVDLAPDLLGIDTHAQAGNLIAADDGNVRGDADGAADEEFIESALLAYDIAAAADGHGQSQIHSGMEIELGVPVQLYGAVNGNGLRLGNLAGGFIDKFTELTVAQNQLHAPHTQAHGGIGAEDLHHRELRADDQLQRRDLFAQENCIVDILNTTMCALQPQNTQAVNIEAGGNAAQEEAHGVHNGRAVVAQDLQTCLQVKGHKMTLAVHAERPIAHGMNGQHALQCGHIHNVRRNAQSQLHVDTQILSAKEDIIDGNRCHVKARSIIHRHIGESAGIHIFRCCIGIDGSGTIIRLSVQCADLIRREADAVVLCRIPGGTQRILGLACSVQNVLLIRAGGDQEGQIHCRTEGNQTGLASLVGGSALMGDDTQFAVLQIEQQTHQILEGLTHRGPQQRDGLACHVASFAVLIVGNQVVFTACFQLCQSCHTGMYIGTAAGGVDIRVKVDGNGAVLFRNGTGTAPDIQRTVQGHNIVVFVVGNTLKGNAAVGGLLGNKVALEFQQNGFPVCTAAFQPVPVNFFIGKLLDGVLQIIALQDCQEAVGFVPVFFLIGNMELQRPAGNILLAGVHIIQSQLIHTLRQRAGILLIEDHADHIGRIVDLELGGGDGESLDAIYLLAIHAGDLQAVGALVQQHGEVLTGNVEVADTGGEDGVGRGAGKLQLGDFGHGAGAQNITVSLAQQIFLHDLAGAHGCIIADIVNFVLDAAILTGFLRFCPEVPVDIQLFTSSHVGDLDGVGFINGTVGGIALLIQRLDTAGGGNDDPDVRIIPGSNILDVGLDVKRTAVFVSTAVFASVCIHRILDHVGSIDVHCDGIIFFHGFVGIDTIVGSRGSTGTRRHLTHVKIQGIGTVGGQILLVAVIGEGHGDIRGVVEHGGCQIIPVTEDGLVRHALPRIHGRIDGVGNDSGIFRPVHGIEGLIVAALTQSGLPLQIIRAHLVIGIVLVAQCGVHQDTALHLCRIAVVLHGVTDLGGAMFRGAGIYQNNGLGESQIIHRPGGNHLVTGLGNGQAGASPVFSAEDILLGLPVSGHLEGGKGGVILVVFKHQIFIVIGLVDLIAGHCANAEAGGFIGNGNLQIAIVQFLTAGYLRGTGSHSAEALQGGDRHQACHHPKDDQEGKYSFNT